MRSWRVHARCMLRMRDVESRYRLCERPDRVERVLYARCSAALDVSRANESCSWLTNKVDLLGPLHLLPLRMHLKHAGSVRSHYPGQTVPMLSTYWTDSLASPLAFGTSST